MRRAISAQDSAADTLRNFCAEDLLERLRPLDAPGAVQTVEEYASDHGVTPQAVRKWIARGRLDAMKTPSRLADPARGSSPTVQTDDRMTSARLWLESVGFLPHKVTVYENLISAASCISVGARVATGGSDRLASRLRDDRGRICQDTRRTALAEAQAQYEVLCGRRLSSNARTTPLTIGETWPIVSARDGLYPVATPHAKEAARAILDAARILGSETVWDVIDRACIRRLGRARVDEMRARGHAGYRSAEVTVQRVLTVAAWLRDEGKVAGNACLTPRGGGKTFAAIGSRRSRCPLPRSAQPRHSLRKCGSCFSSRRQLILGSR